MRVNFNVDKIDIHSLPSLPIPERYNLPLIGSVYFVLSEGDEVLYIGKTKRLFQRWKAHECCAELDNPKRARIAWLEVEDEIERCSLEKELISKYCPRLNRNSKPIQKPIRRQECSDFSNIDDFLTTRETAEILGISDARIRQLIYAGRLPSQKIGQMNLIKKSDLELVRIRKSGRPKKDNSIKAKEIKK